MFYITGRNEKLGDSTNAEFIKDEKKFFQSNSYLLGFKRGSPLPPYTPLLDSDSNDLRELATELYRLPYAEKELLWQLQESEIDIPTLLATEGIIIEAQEHAKVFRQYLNDPLISTPWLSLDSILTSNFVLDIFPELCGVAAGGFSRLRKLDVIDPLYQAINTRDALIYQSVLSYFYNLAKQSILDR
jgi:hypothetical protein